jgi:ABC-type transport system involved in multi-copper enzyme maturation permease subunit
LTGTSLVPSVSSEWIKFRSVRSTVYTLLTTFVLCVGFGAIATFATRSRWGQEGFVDKLTFDPTRTSLAGFTFAEIAIGVIGVLIVSSEYSSGSIRTTLAATPRRINVALAKAIVLFVTTIVVAELCSVISFLVGQAILSGNASIPTASLSQSDPLRAVLLGGFSLALLALLAMGITLMIRHTAGSITTYVGILLILFIVVALLPTSWNVHIFKFLPEVLSESMRSATSQGSQFHTFTPWVSTAILACYAIAALIGGVFMLVRRDA